MISWWECDKRFGGVFKIKHVAIGHKLSMHAKKLRATVRDSNLKRGKYNKNTLKSNSYNWGNFIGEKHTNL